MSSKLRQSLSDNLRVVIENKNMVFSSFRRYFSMRRQSSKVQALYDHCKTMLSPSGTAPPSSQALQKLSSILDTIQPADVGLKEETADDDRGHGFFGANVLNRVARWAQPITYVDIRECDSFTMCIFCFPTSSVIPLHDHPGMTVFSKLLYGSLHVKAYDWVEPPCIVENKGPGYAQVRLAKLAVDKVLNAPCETSVLYPKHGGNLHCFTAVTPCAMLDVLTPPYREDEGRKCTYYHDYPYSAFSAGNAPICDGEEEEYAWLAELESPSDLYMRQGVYAGPGIQL
ncbi:Plant cysteine oxidase 3 [Spatholobus suberectus]|nr:Plant cysteine oxidase 3 [Spatholobus suberectus]